MRRWAGAVLAFAVAACTPGAPAGKTVHHASTKQEQAKKLPGEYTCSFESSDEALGDARCAIDRGAKGFRLDASGGAHVLHGTLTPTDYGFKFEGEYACSEGESCKQAVRTDFFEKEDGLYSGVVELLEAGKLLTVTLRRGR